MDALLQDVRYGTRLLLRQPGFTLIATLTLALGIGANSAIFSVVNSVLIESLPYKEPDRVVMIWETLPSAGIFQNTPAPINYNYWREHAENFESIATFTVGFANLTGAGEPEQLRGLRISANLFPLLGVEPAVGRNFLEEEDRPGASKVVILSDGLWQRQFGADPDILGKSVRFNGTPFIVVGVMGSEFQFPLVLSLQPDFWVPIAFSPEAARDWSRNNWVVGRLKPGITYEQAQSEMESHVARIHELHPKNVGWGVNVVPLREQLVASIRPALLMLLAAAGFVLLIACANVANLLLARATARQKETAIRTALGAGRWRLLRQFLTESVLLAALGGAAGLLLAMWGVEALTAMMPDSLAQARGTEVDFAVFGFTLLASVLTGVICGLAPAISAFRPNLSETLKEGGRDAKAAGRSLLRNSFVIAEVALALVLLVGGGLMIRSIIRLSTVEMGFKPDDVLTMQITLPSGRYSDLQSRTAFFDRLFEEIGAIPGVESAAAIDGLPVSFQGGGSTFVVEGRTEPNQQSPLCYNRIVSPDYFRALGIPLTVGRSFTTRDRADSEKVVVVSETFARQVWPGEDALGKRLGWLGGDWMTVIAVAGDVRISRTAEIKPFVYLPLTQWMAQRPADLAIKTKGDPMNFVAAVRGAVSRVEGDLPVARVRSMEQVLSQSIARSRFNMMLLVIFAALALVLSAIGIYGVMSYTVAQSTREIGIRMALGAQTNDVLRLIVGHGLLLTLIGVATGAASAFALTRLMESLLFGVSPTDPLTFVAVSIVLVAAAMLACYIPARHATRIDPMVALRYE